MDVVIASQYRICTEYTELILYIYSHSSYCIEDQYVHTPAAPQSGGQTVSLCKYSFSRVIQAAFYNATYPT